LPILTNLFSFKLLLISKNSSSELKTRFENGDITSPYEIFYEPTWLDVIQIFDYELDYWNETCINQELRDLGFKMLIPVHDEIIAECPVENSARCAELMSQCMLNAGKDLCVPLKCDTDAFYHWYGDKLDPVTLEPLGEH
jgi:hypothetical protein